MPSAAKIVVRQPARSRYAQARFECEGGHVTKCYAWDNVNEVKCGECGEPASRLLYRTATWGTPATEYAYNPTTDKLWVPAIPGTPPPAGYVSREIRTWRDRDRFYKAARARAEAQHENYAERHELEFGGLIADGAARLRDYLREGHVPEIDKATNQPTGRMEKLSAEGRDLIRLALEKPQYERPKWSGADVSIDSWENSDRRG